MHSSFRDFQSYLRVLGSLDENDIQLILKQDCSKYTTYKIPPGAYTFKDVSIVLSRGFENDFELRVRMQPSHKKDHHDSIHIESDNVTLITILDLKPIIKVLRFDKKPILNTISGFPPYWN